MRLFLYGTLQRPPTLARFAGRTLAQTPAELFGWQRARLRGTVYPTLHRAPGRVTGSLVTADAAALRRLAAYEGAQYRLMRVSVRAGRHVLPAFAWIARPATNRPWP